MDYIKVCIIERKGNCVRGTAVVVIVWYLDLQHVQSVAIITKVVSSNPVHAEMY